jgi:hypothetical protein
MEPKKDKLSSLMQKSKLEMPFSDFEDSTIKRIQTELKYNSSIRRSLQISVFFFVLGTGFGLVVNNMLLKADNAILGVSPDTLLLCFQLIFVLVVLTQSENIYRFSMKLKKK